MKKLLLSFTLACPLFAIAQTPYETHDSININNINARVNLHGDIWDDIADGSAACRFPNGSMKNVGFGSYLILSGFENGNIMHLSAAEYLSVGGPTPPGIDYWPGPLDNAGNTDNTTISKWAKIWKVNKTDIDNFLAQTSHTLSNTPDAILRWPAYNNPYATGANSIDINITEDMAPFHDVNGDGEYEPLLGDYPKIKGKQMLWWVINDNSPVHSNTATLPLKVQVEISAYAYSQGTLIDNVVYYEFKIKNKSGINYTNVRFGQFADFDLGAYYDDYVGFDSSFRMGYQYNAKDTDGITNNPLMYGTNIPVAGLTFVHTPGDNGNYHEPLGAFKSETLSGSSSTTAAYYDGVLHSMIPFPNECTNNNPPGDRRFIIGTRDFNLNSNSFETIVMALVIADPNDHNACPDFDSVTMAIVADTAWGHFDWPLSVQNNSITQTALKLYPNPTDNELTLESSESFIDAEIMVIDALGRKYVLPTEIKNRKVVIKTEQLATGFYTVTINNNGNMYTKPFIKK